MKAISKLKFVTISILVAMLSVAIIPSHYSVIYNYGTQKAISAIFVLSLVLFTLNGVFGFILLILFGIVFFIVSMYGGAHQYFIGVFVLLSFSYLFGASLNIIYGNLKYLWKYRQELKKTYYYKYIDPAWDGMDNTKFDGLDNALSLYLSEKSSKYRIDKATSAFKYVKKQKLLDLRAHLKIEDVKTKRKIVPSISSYVSAFGTTITLLNKFDAFRFFNDATKLFIRKIGFEKLENATNIVISISPYFLAGMWSFVIVVVIINYKRRNFIEEIIEIVENALRRKQSD